MKKLKIGVLNETKTPQDKRVAITPTLGVEILKKYKNIELFIQPSELRCFTDDEYKNAGLTLKQDLTDCDILIGIKEVKKEALIPDKTYMFFAHVAKKQPYNKVLFEELIRKKITLIDYEYITNQMCNRVVAFGKWAGIVGVYNGLIAYGKKLNLYSIKRASECYDFEEMKTELKKIKLPAIKILITGKGRVGKGALETLSELKIKIVEPDEFLTRTFNEPVICAIDADVYTKRKDGNKFEFAHFFKNPEIYDENFHAFPKVADLYIACHFWDPKSPELLSSEVYKSADFKIKVISDVSCDIKKPIASTLRASTIAEPFYDYNRFTGLEEKPFSNEKNVTVIAVDNLPGELPRDSSEYFGRELFNNVCDYLFGEDTDGFIHRAKILHKGEITERYNYLKNW